MAVAIFIVVPYVKNGVFAIVSNQRRFAIKNGRGAASNDVAGHKLVA